MSEPAPAKTPADARELLDFINLTDVRYYEVSARRVDDPEDRPDEPQPTMELMEHHDDQKLIARFRMTVATRAADLKADLAVHYAISEPLHLTPPVVAEFLEKVAVMAAYPYLRESIATSAVRLGIDVPTLGLMKQGDLQVELPGTVSEDDPPTQQ